jgi:hypothetical protein
MVFDETVVDETMVSRRGTLNSAGMYITLPPGLRSLKERQKSAGNPEVGRAEAVLSP